MKKRLFSLLLCMAFALSLLSWAAPARALAAEKKLTDESRSLYVGETFKLKLKNASGTVKWKSSNTSVAKVKKGKVTALKAGKATITATNKGKKYKCKVTVTEFEGALTAVQSMKIGWNLGNYFDVTEKVFKNRSIDRLITGWGNPIVDESLFKHLKELGFGAVRVPVTWIYHFDEDGNIDPEWMARVKEVVDWVLDNDMYCIINMHHDTGEDNKSMDRWLFASMDNFEKNNELFSYLWAQIADEFKDYPERLLFEGFNEMLDENGDWMDASEDAAQAVNEYNQLFVNTVRKTGGKNATRNLICNHYAAGITESELYYFIQPNDTVKDHIIGQAHFYMPYQFVNEDQPDTVFTKKLQEAMEGDLGFVCDAYYSRGVDENGNQCLLPYIIGEFGANDKGNTEERIKYYKHVIEFVKERGDTCFIWDNGNPEEFGLINRSGGEDYFPEIIEACIEAANNTHWVDKNE